MELEQMEFASELTSEVKTVTITLKLNKGDWPKNNWTDRTLHRDMDTHELQFDDFISSKQYIRGSYNDHKSKTFTFDTTSTTFSLYYKGMNRARHAKAAGGHIHDDGTTWSHSTQFYTIPADRDSYEVPLTIDGERAYNLGYTDWMIENVGW